MSKQIYQDKFYTHFDIKKYHKEYQQKVQNIKWVSKHGFYPFIHFQMNCSKYTNDLKGHKFLKEKVRDIYYAAHIDRFIYEYYGNRLNNQYNNYVKSKGIGKVSTAYRNCMPGKCNIDFAKEVFEYIVKCKSAYIFVGDFSKFFDKLDHKYLKEKIKCVIGHAVEETINVMRKQRVTYTEAAADRAAQKDDRVTVNFTGTKEGIEFPGGKAEGFQFVIGSGRMLAEFDAAVAGMKAGESKTFDLTFPKEYGPADLNGATVQFLVEVTKVEEPHFPTIDDEFAQSLGVKDGVAAMRADVKKNLEREVSYRLEQRTAAEVFSALDKVLTFPVPAAVVEEERRAMAQQYAQAMRSREAPKDIPDSMFQEPAVKKARVGLFISEVVQREKLTATDEQITARAQSIAASYENPAEVVQYLTTDRQSRVNVAMQVQEENVTNWLLGQATTEEVPVEFDKVMKGEF